MFRLHKTVKNEIMDIITLNAVTRKPEKHQAKKLRKEAKIPGVIYGKGNDPIPVTVDDKEFVKVFRVAGENSIVDLKVDDKDVKKIIIQHISQHPVTEKVMSVDFKEVDMKKKIKAKIPLKMVGVAPAVKDFSGLFLVKKHEIEVECLPNELVHELEVDISGLLNIGDNIHVGDVKLPGSFELIDAEDLMIAQVVMPKVKASDESTAEGEEEGEEGATEGAEGATPAEGADSGDASGEKSESTGSEEQSS